MEIAEEYGMPSTATRNVMSAFDGRTARVLRQALPLTPHEASHDEVWSYLTCCWLLDIAMWRFGVNADERRFIGNVNRNTFRRLWWRAEILGPELDLTRLGEDELVNIMERPTVASDRRLAQAIATEFLARIARDETGERMQLMREVMKRLLRLTPFLSFAALDDETIRSTVSDTFDAAAAGLGMKLRAAKRESVEVAGPLASPDVISLEKVVIRGGDGMHAAAHGDESIHSEELDTVVRAALAIARRTGRVTNATLREVVPISAVEARQVLKTLTDRHELESRGAKRGTHYVIPERTITARNMAYSRGESPTSDVTDATPTPPSTLETARGPADSALRRLLRRKR